MKSSTKTQFGWTEDDINVAQKCADRLKACVIKLNQEKEQHEQENAVEEKRRFMKVIGLKLSDNEFGHKLLDYVPHTINDLKEEDNTEEQNQEGNV